MQMIPFIEMTKKQKHITMHEIFEKVAEGSSVHKIIKKKGNNHYPGFSAFYYHIREHEELEKKYLIAKDIGMERRAQEIEEIADTKIARGDMSAVAKQRLRIDTRKWLLSKLVPKRYGDKVDVNHGGQGDNPVIEIKRTIVDPENV